MRYEYFDLSKDIKHIENRKQGSIYVHKKIFQPQNTHLRIPSGDKCSKNEFFNIKGEEI